MKFLLVVSVLSVVSCMLTPSLAAPLQEEEEDAKAILQVIRMLLASENQGRSESEDTTTNSSVTSSPSDQSPNATATTSPPATSSLSAQSLNATGPCEVEDSDKVECGYVGITQAQCEGNGCCWKESSVSGVPFCFHKVETAPRCQTNDRVECGYFGINEAECEYRGCCWSPTTVNGQPWCYHEKALGAQCQTDPSDRTRCGYLGISGEQCKASGCCWSPTSSSGRPWCFLNVTVTDTPTSLAERKIMDLLRFVNRKS